MHQGCKRQAWQHTKHALQELHIVQPASIPCHTVHVQNIEQIKRTETLDAKEKALQAKEAELRRWEADLRATGGLKPKKNWPWLCPIVHHDIAAEVNPSHDETV